MVTRDPDPVAAWLALEDITWVDPDVLGVANDPRRIATLTEGDIRRKTDGGPFTVEKMSEAIARLRTFLLEDGQNEARDAFPIALLEAATISVDFSVRLASAIRDTNSRDWGLEWVSNACAEAQVFTVARGAAMMMSSDTMRGRALAFIAERQAMSSDLSAALETIALVADADQRVQGLCLLMEARPSNRWDAQMDATLWDALDETRDIDFELTRADLLARIARIQIKLGRSTDARNTAEEMIHVAEGVPR